VLAWAGAVLAADPASTQAEIDGAFAAIVAGAGSLVPRGDTSSLAGIVDALVSGLQPAYSYTAASWAVWQGALADAEALLAGDLTEVTVAQVTASESALNTAYAGLTASPQQPDRTALLASLTVADGLLADSGSYMSAGVDALRVVVTAAQGVVDRPTSTQAQVDAVAGQLTAAINGLEVKGDVLGVVVLAATIRDVLDPLAYTPVSWSTLQAALETVDDLADALEVSVSVVARAEAALTGARAGLVARANTAGLVSMIQVGSALAATTGVYVSTAGLSAALAGASVVAGDGNASQAAVDAQVSAILVQIALLQALPPVEIEVPVEVPGPTQTVEVEVPGPTQTVEVEVPGPTQTVTTPGPTQTVTTPGPTRTVTVVTTSEPERVEVPGPTQTVPGPERTVPGPERTVEAPTPTPGVSAVVPDVVAWTARVAPSVASAAVVGGVVAVEGVPASWTVSGYQWLRAGVPIVGATGATYTLTGADAGKAISAQVTAAAAGQGPVVVAAGSFAVPKIVPTVSGKAVAKTVAAGKQGKVRVTVKTPGLSVPTGQVVVRYGKAGSFKSKAYVLKASGKGKVTVKLPRLAKGTYTVQVGFKATDTIAGKAVQTTPKVTSTNKTNTFTLKVK
jgi:hypothetical protein